MIDKSTSQQHSLLEDALALLTATPLVALSITFYNQAELLTGSTAGLAYLQMGWKFTLRTFCAVGLVSVFTEITPLWISIESINPIYAAALGGMCLGLGMLLLFRHRASLGGINILALYLQDRFDIRAGKFQMGVDLVIVMLAIMVLPLDKVLLSITGAAVLNMILTLNHKQGRYQGIS